MGMTEAAQEALRGLRSEYPNKERRDDHSGEPQFDQARPE
jgi:hypothetical protein